MRYATDGQGCEVGGGFPATDVKTGIGSRIFVRLLKLGYSKPLAYQRRTSYPRIQYQKICMGGVSLGGPQRRAPIGGGAGQNTADKRNFAENPPA
jgi:hypothetical protein